MLLEGLTPFLIHRDTGEYIMAEWKMRSTAFKRNHSPEDVDVLVCWIDDEGDRGNLPRDVLDLREIARLAASEAISPD
ncbi:MAG: hypothetical protein U5L08_07875 [Xanthomonadales bacterium]|nr:hypothetical protein [Xanthomonadales bacterium]